MRQAIEKFEDLEVWKISMKLSESLFQRLKNHAPHPLTDQLLRSALSTPSNITEGFERNSNKEFIRFLSIAQGSCAELRTQLSLAQRISLIDSGKIAEWIETSRFSMLNRLIQVRKARFS